MRQDLSLILGSPYPFLLTVSVRSADQADAAHHWILAEPLTLCCREKPVLRFDHYDLDGDPVPQAHTVVCGECADALPLKLSDREIYSSSPLYAVSLFYATSTDAEGQVGTFDRVGISDFVLAWVNDLHSHVLEAEVIGRDTAAELIGRAELELTQRGWAPVGDGVWRKPDSA